MYCQKCGKEIDDEAVVCIHCGCATEKSTCKKAKTGAEREKLMEQIMMEKAVHGTYLKTLCRRKIINQEKQNANKLFNMRSYHNEI